MQEYLRCHVPIDCVQQTEYKEVFSVGKEFTGLVQMYVHISLLFRL